MFTALLDAIDIKGRLITADALLTQRKLADYLVQRGAHYHFTAKGNQATLEKTLLSCLKSARRLTSVMFHRPIMDVLRLGVFGAATRSMAISTFLMLDRSF